MARKKDKPTTSRMTTRRVEAPLVVDRTTVEVSADQRSQMIAECAYYMAAARGFAPGNELDDWLAAEVAIDHQLSN